MGSLLLNPPPISSTTPPWSYSGVELNFFKALSVVETMLISFVSVREKYTRIDIKKTLFLCFYPQQFPEKPTTTQLSTIGYQFQAEFSCK